MCSQNSVMATRVNVIFVNVFVSYFLPLDFSLSILKSSLIIGGVFSTLTVMVVHTLCQQEFLKWFLKDRFFSYFSSHICGGKGGRKGWGEPTTSQANFNDLSFGLHSEMCALGFSSVYLAFSLHVYTVLCFIPSFQGNLKPLCHLPESSFVFIKSWHSLWDLFLSETGGEKFFF